MSYQRRPVTRPNSFYSSTQPSYNSFGGYNSSFSQSSPYLNNSPTSYSTYGGTSSGYGGLLLPSHSSTSLHSLSTSPSLYNSLLSSLSNSRSSSPGYTQNSYSPTHRSPSSSRLPSRSGSFNRQLSKRSSRISDLSTLSGSTKSLNSEGYESGGEKSETTSRVNNVSREDESKVADNDEENGDIIDYKKLYEESQRENERLREKLKRTEEDLAQAKIIADKNALLMKNSLPEAEKRERRAMERKLSEMEEELKQLQKLKSDNERLRAENRALTRVVTKLTTSHNK